MPQNSPVDLTILIVSFNTRDLLRACLRSIYEQTSALRFEVLIFDNASSDHSIDMVRAEFPDVFVIASEENLGFARANNALMPHAQGQYVVLLNPDTVITDHALEKLAHTLNAFAEIGAVAPRLMLPNGTPQGGDAGYDPSPSTLFVFAFMLHSLFPHLHGFWLTKQNYSGILMEVDWITGACLMVRREIILSVGGLSDSFFMYAEDIEWCYRIKQAGWKIVMQNSVSIVHHHGASTKQKKGSFGRSAIRGLDIYYQMRHPRYRILIMHALGAIGFMLRAVLFMIVALVKRDSRYRISAADMWSASRASGSYAINLVAPHVSQHPRQS